MKNRSQIAPSCFSGSAKLVDLSPPVAWLGILLVLHLILVIHHTAALAFAVNFISKDLEKRYFVAMECAEVVAFTFAT